jgi:hypothetical protein
MRLVAGLVFVAFQVLLILSGNLSFLNWLTIVPALACFDDAALARLLPARWRDRALSPRAAPGTAAAGVTAAYALVVAVLSINPVFNLFSPTQAMNMSFDRLRLVNTYGAFGSVGRVRHEVILEGTRESEPGPETRWEEYEFPCKPGDVMRRPCWVSPYHYRLDWQMWFAALSNPQREPWIVNFTYHLLRGDRELQALLARDPFPDAPPRFIRAQFYRYEMQRPGTRDGYWKRTLVATYFPPLRLGDRGLEAFPAQ